MNSHIVNLVVFIVLFVGSVLLGLKFSRQFVREREGQDHRQHPGVKLIDDARAAGIRFDENAQQKIIQRIESAKDQDAEVARLREEMNLK